MDSSAEPAGSVLAYARTLTGQLITVSGGLLQAAYLHGSAALGGWMPGRSDVDMLFVTADGIGSGVAERMCQVLCEAAGQCPAGTGVQRGHRGAGQAARAALAVCAACRGRSWEA